MISDQAAKVRSTMPSKYTAFLFAASGLFALIASTTCLPAAESPPPGSAMRTLYAVNQAAEKRGSVSVYDIDSGHRLIKTIQTVPNVADVRGVAVSAATGKLYVAYRRVSGAAMIYCLNVYNDTVLWNKEVSPGVDRLAINPDGRLLYVPTWEEGSANFINIVNADTGDVVSKVFFSNRSHDTQYPLSGPVFQETKARDESSRYLYMIDPTRYTVSSIGPYSGILGPYAVDSTSTYVVNNVTGIWGMEVANLKTGKIVTAIIPNHRPRHVELLHGIGWTPDQSEVWQASTARDPYVYIWDMLNPMAPVLKDRLTLRSGSGTHWLTFDIKGDYGYVAPNKGSSDGTEVFDAHTHASVGVIGSTEDMLEIDFANGKISQVGDQYGIGRRDGKLSQVGN
jgi:hypothetical protein